jgi:hypothetical protein
MSSNVTAMFPNNNNTSREPTLVLFNMPIFFTICYVYAMPAISLVGFLLNCLCVRVLLHPKLRSEANKYLLFKTVLHILLLILTSTSPVVTCAFCPISQTYQAQVYHLYVLVYVSNALFTCTSLVEIALSYETLLMFKQKMKNIPFIYFCSFAIAFSLLYNVPYTLTNTIERLTGTLNFIQMPTNFGKSTVYRIFNILGTFLQSFIALIILIILNTFIVIEFKRYMSKKAGLTSNASVMPKSRLVVPSRIHENDFSMSNSIVADTTQKNTGLSLNNQKNRTRPASRKFTTMFLMASIFYSISRLLNLINISTNQIYQLNGITSNQFTFYFSPLTSLITLFYFGTNLFTYLTFNKIFRECFRKIFF